jgi:acid phosphatase
MKGKIALVAMLGLALAPAAAYGHGKGGHGHDNGNGSMKQIDRIVVIYEENHSFDNLYGMWEKVDGLRNADPSHTTQINQAGQPYSCLMQNDVNLTSPPQPADCTNTNPAFTSHFKNAPFTIDDFIAPTDTTCPVPGAPFAPNGVAKGSGLPGGCTRDLVHRFYQEQYQLNGGAQNRYTTGSDAVGLTQGVYDTRSLPIYEYLHEKGAPRYAIADRFFQAAFGGSFLNHQWLIAAATPIDTNDTTGLHPLLDSNGMPTSYPLYTATGPVADGRPLTAECPAPKGMLCGDYAVNTIQPPYQPHGSGAQLSPQETPTIGDRLSGKGISWAWYSGGWSNAAGDVGGPGWTNGSTPGTCTDPNSVGSANYPNCPDKLFQYHHQPFNYFANYAPKQPGRQHLRDEQEFIADAKASRSSCKLAQVSFIKPIGAENEHPGYASAHAGSTHLVDLLTDIQGSKCAKSTMVVVTYDEFGGQWDHVPPPGQGTTTPGPHDLHGPGTRIPALILAPGLPSKFVVDHTSHDTTSIMATIEHRFGLAPVADRDRKVADLSSVFKKGRRHHH